MPIKTQAQLRAIEARPPGALGGWESALFGASLGRLLGLAKWSLCLV